jgi:ribonuclease HII
MKREEREQMLREKLHQMKQYEEALRKSGVRYATGVDEAGRGPLAGPVVAAAVALPEDFAILGVDDSKRISPKKREALYDLLMDNTLAVGIGVVSNEVIDEINILHATMTAMSKAIQEMSERLDGTSIHALIDGLQCPDTDIPCTALVKGDQKSVSVAAASIVAKVTRDRIMIQYDRLYPGYDLGSNKGYGTRAHYEGLRWLGVTPIHRKTFLHGDFPVRT